MKKVITMPNDEWRTPYKIIDKARSVMGSIDCDPATSEYANRYIQAPQYYTCDKSGLRLSTPWQGNVFLNPPYSMPLIQEFINRAMFHSQHGNTSQSVILVNSCTDTKWFQALVGYTRMGDGIIMFTRKRISFLLPCEEIVADQNRVGQTLFYWGSKSALFQEIFSDIAYIL